MNKCIIPFFPLEIFKLAMEKPKFIEFYYTVSILEVKHVISNILIYIKAFHMQIIIFLY